MAKSIELLNRWGLTSNIKKNVPVRKIFIGPPGIKESMTIEKVGPLTNKGGKLYADWVKYKKDYITLRGALVIADLLSAGALLGINFIL